MGANFNSVTFPACSAEQLKKDFLQEQENALSQYGSDSYSGHIGMARGLQISSMVFKTLEQAEDYVDNRAQKWGPAIAVKVGDFSQIFPVTPSDKKLYDTYKALNSLLENWDSNIIKRVKASKSAQKSCDQCKSKISLAYIKTNSCPVCGNNNFLQTLTDVNKLKALKEKIIVTSNKVQEVKKKYELKNKNNFWYVGALCAC